MNDVTTKLNAVFDLEFHEDDVNLIEMYPNSNYNVMTAYSGKAYKVIRLTAMATGGAMIHFAIDGSPTFIPCRDMTEVLTRIDIN